MRLAIDDAGAGFASLMHILKLAPDFIKLDRELINGIDIDPVRRALAGSLMRFAEDTGATLIAEGVETATELLALSDLGIRHAQGFYLARPMGIEAAARRARDGDAHSQIRRRAGERISPAAAVRNLIRAGGYWASRRVRKCRPTALLTALGVSERVTLKPASVTIRRTSLLENRWGWARTKVVSRHFRLETSLKRASPSAEKVSTAT